jgi:hypothetical protein
MKWDSNVLLRCPVRLSGREAWFDSLLIYPSNQPIYPR